MGCAYGTEACLQGSKSEAYCNSEGMTLPKILDISPNNYLIIEHSGLQTLMRRKQVAKAIYFKNIHFICSHEGNKQGDTTRGWEKGSTGIKDKGVLLREQNQGLLKELLSKSLSVEFHYYYESVTTICLMHHFLK